MGLAAGAAPAFRTDLHEVEIVVPVYNEAATLTASITRLRQYLDGFFPFRTLVTIADNGSTDGTALTAQHLAAILPGVRALILTRKGRGYALRTAWAASRAEVVAYMDVDLSTSLAALLPLVGSVLSGHSELAIGTRLARGARVVRGPKRELISRAYSHIVRLSLHSRLSDFQCGFKAMRRERALQILPMVEDDAWFFDTELLVAAERMGVRIMETPVEWTDDPHSSVDLVATAAADLRGIWRVVRAPRPRPSLETGPETPDASGVSPATADQLLSFAGVGILSTMSYLLLLAASWHRLGPWVSNAAALAVCTVVNTVLHRTLARSASDARTSGEHRGRPPFVLVMAALYAVSLATTMVAIGVTDAAVGPSLPAAAVAASVASCGAALVRFTLLRGWVFPPGEPQPSTPLRSAPVR